MKIAILTSGILPVPAVHGGAVETLIDFYLEYNNQKKMHDITVYTIYHKDIKNHPALKSEVNHYVYIDVSSFLARIKRKIYHYKHHNEYYNHYIEFFFEQSFKKLSINHYDIVLLENRPGYAYKLSHRGIQSIQLHLHNDLLNATTPFANEIFHSITKIITVSNYIKERVNTIAQTDKVQTVYNGINLDLFSRKEYNHINRSKLGMNETDFVIVYCGRINPDKGISELIDAMILLNENPHIKLLVIGSPFFGGAADDEFTVNLKNKADIIKDRIIFTGFVHYNEVPAYLNLAEIAIIPSIWDDPFPTTVLEAQAMSLPLIVTNRGGIPEEIGEDNAIVVPTGPEFELRLSKAIVQLYNHPEQRDAMSKSSLANSIKYDKNRFAKDILNAITI